MKGGFEARAAQHDSLARMIMAEFVRRHHLQETWRHMVPKRFLPLIAALIAADVKCDDIKPNSALLNAQQSDGSEVIVCEGKHQHFVQIYSPSLARNTPSGAEWDQENRCYNDPEHKLAVIQYNHLRDFTRVIEFGSCY
jgi:hypothetical protein